MPRLGCPQCHAEVVVEPAQTPVCPSCGFGSNAAPANPETNPQPAPKPAPEPAPGAPPAKLGGTRIAIIAGAVGVLAIGVVAFLLLGLGGTGVLSPQEASQQADLAMENLQGDLMDPADADLREMDVQVSTDGIEEEGFNMGPMSIHMSIEWGKQDMAHVKFDVEAGALSYKMEAWCSPDTRIEKRGTVVFEGRPDPDECNELFADDMPGEGVDPSEFDNMTQVAATANEDGSVDAVYEDDEGNQFMVHVDPQGRVTKIGIAGEEGTGTVIISYGTRQQITPPQATERLPASAHTFGWWMNGQHEASVTGKPLAPLGEFEVRILDNDRAIVAKFQLVSGTGADGDFSFDYADDGDGLLGDNDTLTVIYTGQGDANDYDVVVWDAWADAEIGADTPGPGILAPIAALGLAYQWRSRKGRKSS